MPYPLYYFSGPQPSVCLFPPGALSGSESRDGTHHEQIASHHAGCADFREGMQDVVQCGGGEGVDLLGHVLRQGLLCQLERGGKWV